MKVSSIGVFNYNLLMKKSSHVQGSAKKAQPNNYPADILEISRKNNVSFSGEKYKEEDLYKVVPDTWVKEEQVPASYGSPGIRSTEFFMGYKMIKGADENGEPVYEQISYSREEPSRILERGYYTPVEYSSEVFYKPYEKLDKKTAFDVISKSIDKPSFETNIKYIFQRDLGEYIAAHNAYDKILRIMTQGKLPHSNKLDCILINDGNKGESLAALTAEGKHSLTVPVLKYFLKTHNIDEAEELREKSKKNCMIYEQDNSKHADYVIIKTLTAQKREKEAEKLFEYYQKTNNELNKTQFFDIKYSI